MFINVFNLILYCFLFLIVCYTLYGFACTLNNFYHSIQVQVLNLSTSTLQIICSEKKGYILIINLYNDNTFRISILFVVCIRSERVNYISGYINVALARQQRSISCLP